METKRKENVDALSKKGACIEFFSAYQEMDIDRMIQLCDPEGGVFFEPLGDAGKGKIGEFGRNLWLALMDAFPDLDNTVIKAEMNEEGNTVNCTVSIFGTQEKEFAGLPSKGNRFESDHIFVFRFNEDEKIDKININWDHEGFVQQLQG
jgi:predicted ester cyclase